MLGEKALGARFNSIVGEALGGGQGMLGGVICLNIQTSNIL